jgi:hypothetical protein
MPSLKPLRAYETKLEIFERWIKWAEAGHHDSIFIESLDLMGMKRPALLSWRRPPEIVSWPTSAFGSAAEVSAPPQSPPALPCKREPARSVALDEPLHHHDRHRLPRDADLLPVRSAGDAEQ